MKVYQYNLESGVYAGELFEEGDNIQYSEGITLVAPPDYTAGQVPVFDMQRSVWEVMPVSAVRQLLGIKKGGGPR